MFVDESEEIDYESLITKNEKDQKKIPISYKVYKERVEFGTIGCVMNSVDLIDNINVHILERASDGDVEDQFSELNDEAIRIFIDFHWERNYKKVIHASLIYIVYGMLLITTSFWCCNKVLLIITGSLSYALLN